MMTLQIATPSVIALEKNDVSRIVVETANGSFGILPARLDGVAILVPGVLLFESLQTGEQYAAVDVGVLVKTGRLVRVNVRNAVIAGELGTVKKIVTEDFLSVSEEEKKRRTLLAKIEGDFVKHLLDFRKR